MKQLSEMELNSLCLKMGNAFFCWWHNFTEKWLLLDAIIAHRANANVF
jgi:hypothetical protein